MGQEQNNTQRKKKQALSEKERYKIEALLKIRMTPLKIAKELDRDRRTIEREIKRGSVVQRDYHLVDRMVYLADAGQRVYEENAARKGRSLKIANHHALAQYIENKIIKEKYSPDAVIGEIKVKGLKFGVEISTKTVYNYIDSGVFLNLTNKDLPVKKYGKKRKYQRIRTVALNNTKGTSIDERPDDIEKRDELGHWEMDCVIGKGRACLLVMTERKSRLELIFKLKSKTQNEVIKRIDKLERRHGKGFREKFKTITMDNGCEFLDFTRIEESLLSKKKRTKCYYAHPYCASERGSNEVANRLVRRFIPKGCDIGKLKDADIRQVQDWMNNYPRRMFEYKTSNEIYAA